jgi:hypothetical protein
MRVSLQMGPEDVQGETRESGRRGRSLFLPSGEVARATAVLEHFGWGRCEDFVWSVRGSHL